MPLYLFGSAQLTALVAADNDTSGFIKDTEGWRVIGASGVANALTGTTSETAQATVAIAAGAMGANGLLRVTAHWTCTSSANNKIMRIRFGTGLSGTACLSITNTTVAQALYGVRIHNRNSASSQAVAQINGVDGTTASALTTAAIDTSAATELVISGTLASAAETMTLESYIVELKYGA